MFTDVELGSLGLALVILSSLVGALLVLLMIAGAFFYVANSQRRRLEKTLKHCGLEDYHAKTQEDLKEYGYLQRAPYDTSGIDVKDGVSDDTEFLQMMRDLRQVNKERREEEKSKSDYWGNH